MNYAPMRLLTVLVAAALPVTSEAAAPGYLPTYEVVRTALQAHPTLSAARAERDAAGHGAEAVRKGPHEFEASITPQHRRLPGSISVDEWEAQLSRPVRLPGKATLDAQIASKMRSVAESELLVAALALEEQLLVDWMAWLGAEQQRILTLEQHDLLLRERNMAQAMEAKGALSTLDVDLLEADLAAANARLIQAQAVADRRRQRLATSYPSLPLPATLPTIPDPPLLPVPEDGAALTQSLVSRSPVLAAAKQRFEEQALIADRARADRFADPTVGVRWLREGRDRETAIGVVLSIPLGGGHRKAMAGIESAKESALAAHAEGARLSTQQMAWEQVQDAQALHATWIAERAALAAHRSAAERSRRAWELGEIAIGQYLIAERALLERQLSESNARNDAVTSAVVLQLRAGNLWLPPPSAR